jgi:copper/silver efflux system protein
LVPILWSQQTGSDVLKRIAAPMVGGLITSAGLTLIVLPVIYSLWRESQVRQIGFRNAGIPAIEGRAPVPVGQIVG